MNIKNLISLIWLLIGSVLLNGDIINNSKVPLSKDAGRVIQLEKVFEISDADGDFYLKRPQNIKIAPDDSIFFTDEKQFLKFSKEGKFLGNHQKVGEGPGEFLRIQNYFFDKDMIVIFSQSPNKIIKMNMTGQLLSEKKSGQKSLGIRIILQFDGNRYYYLKGSFKDVAKKNTGKFFFKQQLVWEELSGKKGETEHYFDKKMHMVKIVSKDGISAYLREMFRSSYAVYENKKLIVNNSLNYMIYNIDLSNGKLINQFNRKYKPVAFKKRNPDEKIKGPVRKFFTDVQRILIERKNIWVFTSTIDKEKGILIDVFSIDGKFIDNFYLKLPQVLEVNDFRGRTITIQNNFIYTVERDEDENPIIVKYKFEGNIGQRK